MTRVVVTSDTHEQHQALKVPEGDIFVFAGDFSMVGEPRWVESFNRWLGQLPMAYRVVVAGNHDRSLDIINTEGASVEEARWYGQERLPNATHYLLNAGCEIAGLKFWGSPYTPFFNSDYWKFFYDRAAGKAMWQDVPEDLDMLITHGPPDRILDQTLEGEFAGCFDLAQQVEQVRPRFHVFGHIHEGHGHRFWKGTHFYNVSAVDRLYRLRQEPFLELEL